MEIYKDLELAEVQNEPDRINFTFVDYDSGDCHEIVFRKQRFDPDTSKYVEDEAKLNQCNEWCEKFFNQTIDTIEDAVGQKHDIYSYDTYESLWESVSPYDPELVNKKINGTIESFNEDPYRYEIRYRADGNLYSVKKNFRKEINGQAFVDVQKKKRATAKLEEDLGMSIEDMKSGKLEGMDITVKVKKFGKYTYGEIQ